jgi:hypothetical protein
MFENCGRIGKSLDNKTDALLRNNYTNYFVNELSQKRVLCERDK